MASELLKGFRMLDLTDEKGALCGKMFADLGAEVIKVEAARRMLDAANPAVPRRRSGRRSQPVFPRLPGRQKIRHRSISKAPTAARCVAELAEELRFPGRVVPARLPRFDRPRLRRPREAAIRASSTLRSRRSATRVPARITRGGYHYLGGGRHDVPDGRGGQAAAADGAAAGRTACRRRGRGRFADRALPAPDRRLGSARRRQHAGLHRVDSDERAGDADPARRSSARAAGFSSVRSACGARWFIECKDGYISMLMRAAS